MVRRASAAREYSTVWNIPDLGPVWMEQTWNIPPDDTGYSGPPFLRWNIPGIFHFRGSHFRPPLESQDPLGNISGIFQSTGRGVAGFNWNNSGIFQFVEYSTFGPPYGLPLGNISGIFWGGFQGSGIFQKCANIPTEYSRIFPKYFLLCDH